METPQNWKDVFARWPAEMPRRGVIVARFGEQIPFSAFSVSETFVLVERQTPDSLGARTIVLPYQEIAALKIVDVVKPKVVQQFGFAVPAVPR